MRNFDELYENEFIQEFKTKFNNIMDYYPENRRNYREVLWHLSNGKISPFIGAGMSVPIYNTINEVLNIMVEKAGTRWSDDMVCFEEKVTFMLQQGISKPEFYKMLQELYDVKIINNKPDTLLNMAISCLPKIIKDGIVFTSNYDRVIETVYFNQGTPCEVKYLTDREVINRWLREAQNTLLLVKIHGDILQPEDTIVFDKDSYDRLYEKNGECVTTLRKCLEHRILLFLGSSLQQDRFLDVLRDINEPGIQNYAIYPCKNEERRETYKRLTGNRIFPVLFPDNDFECVKVLMTAIARNYYPQFEVIDADYVESKVIVEANNDEFNDLIQNYYAISGNYKTVMKAVCNNICINIEEIIGRLYEITMQNTSPVFLMADSGSGKTTDLCLLAKYSSRKNITVLFLSITKDTDSRMLDQELQTYIRKNQKLLICIDNINDNRMILDTIYKISKNNRNILNKNIHFIIAAKINEIFRIINTETHHYNDWKKTARAVYLWKNYEDIKKYNEGTMLFFEYQNVYVYENVSLDKRNIIDNSRKYLNSKLNKDENETGSDVCFDIDNSIARANKNHFNALNKKNIKGFLPSSEEDEWIAKTKYLDKFCKKGKISEGFRYMAALQLYHINIRISDLVMMMGFYNKPNINSSVALDIYHDMYCAIKSISYINNDVLTKNDEIEFMHDIVAINYFEGKEDAEEYLHLTLKGLIVNFTLSKDMIIAFEKKVFSARIIDNASRITDIYTYKIDELLQTFCENIEYYNVIVDAGRLYSIATARVLLNSAQGNKKNDGIISDAFNRTYNESKDKKNVLWIKLLNLAIGNSDEFPEALLKYVSPDNYRQLTSLLSKYKKNFKVERNEDEKEALLKYMEEFYKKVLCIDPKDVPAILELGEIYKNKQHYDKQLFLYLNIINQRDIKKEVLNILTKYLVTYEQYHSDCPKIVRNEYEKWLERLANKCDIENDDEYKRYYSTTSSMFGMYLKSIGEFDKAFEIANNMSDDYPESYRKYMVLGYLHQDTRSNNIRSNMSQAISFFELAYKKLKKEISHPGKRSQLRILRPLMNSYIAIRKTVEARRIGELILKIDPKDREVKDILEHNKYMNSSVLEFDGNNILYRVLDDFTASVILFEDNGDTDISVPNVIDNHTIVTIGHNCFGENNHVKKINLPPNIREIQNHAFSGCRNLESINIPSTCTSIGKYAFQWCKSLRTIKLPPELKEIEESTFISCYNLSEIVMPGGLIKIGRRAFMNCQSINIKLPSSVAIIEQEAFVGLSVDQIQSDRHFDLKAEYLYEWPYGEKICHQYWGVGTVTGVSFKKKDIYEISVVFGDNVNRVFLFPNIYDNPFEFEDNTNQHRLDVMIARRKNDG